MLALMRWLETEGGKQPEKQKTQKTWEEKREDGFETEVSLEKMPQKSQVKLAHIQYIKPIIQRQSSKIEQQALARM